MILIWRKAAAKDTLEGNLFYGVLCLFGEAMGHFFVIVLISTGTGIPKDVLPTSVKFPGWEMASFLQLWNPLALSSTMAFSRFAVDYAEDFEHAFVVLCSLIVALCVQMPWFIFQMWCTTPAYRPNMTHARIATPSLLPKSVPPSLCLGFFSLPPALFAACDASFATSCRWLESTGASSEARERGWREGSSRRGC